MIQLLKLRTFIREGKEKKYDAFIVEGLHAETVPELFANIESYIKKIPKDERWNCFYTLANCTSKKREFQSLSVLYFDFDEIDNTRHEEYITVICKTLGIKREETGIVASGNGLHFIIGLTTPIVDKKFFDQSREHYKAVLHSLKQALTLAGLPVKVDPSVYDARRFFRLPGTVNRKPGKKEVVAKLYNSKIVNIPFDITLASGIPQVRREDQVDPSYFKKFPKVDNAAIFKGCSFMNHARLDGAELDEPELYAALSIMGRMEKAEEVATSCFSGRFGKRHHGGSPEDLALKLEQATNASGPRMCKSIAQLWKGCATCPHFKNQSSPILIRGEDTLKTEHTGFHDIVFDEETQKPKRGKPNYSDLRKFFERHHAYRSHDKIIWVWSGTHYEEMSNEELKNFAQKHFEPYASAAMRGEFLDLVQCTNLVQQEIWNAGTFGKINLKNGVLDLEKMELSPHSKDYGFKYVLPYDYDPKAKAPRFLKFLEEVCGGNEILINTLLEFGGYALSGAHCKYHKALVLEGEGNNGKSTFIEVLKDLAGRKSFSALAFKDLDQTERRSALDGVLFNITEETPSKINDTTSFKNLISGGDLQLRKLYKNAYFIKNKAKLIFSCNEMPMSSDNSRGFFRRFLIVPFNVKFSKALGNIDLDIGDRLRQELPGVLNLFLEGYQRLVRQGGFSKQEDDDQDLERYQEAIDPLVVWIKETLIVHPLPSEQFVSATALFESFRTWCEKNGFDPRVKNAVSLGIQIRRYIPDIERRRVFRREDGTVVRRIKGLSLKEGEF
jgi:putative DNA primase/helicase